MNYFIIVLGVVIFGVGMYWSIIAKVSSKYGFHTRGTVLKIVGKWEFSAGKLNYLFYPIIGFKDQNNKHLELKMDIGGSIPLFYKGQSLKLVYYKNKIYPSGIGWNVFYLVFALLGIGIILYQLV